MEEIPAQLSRFIVAKSLRASADKMRLDHQQVTLVAFSPSISTRTI